MNILIIGGLLVLAVVAILGAVLLGISEDRTEKTRKANEAAHLPQPSSTQQLAEATPAPSVLPPSTPRAPGQLTPYATGQLLPPNEAEHLAVRKTGQLPAPNEEERFTILNGQVHEITGELRSLAQKASELEQRLNVLSEVLERQQYHPADAPTQFYAPTTDTSSF